MRRGARQSRVDRGAKFLQRRLAPSFPLPGQHVVEKYVEQDACVTPQAFGREGLDLGDHGMGIGHAVDAPVQPDRAFDIRRPGREVGTTREIATAIAYLASDEAAYITGQTLRVNGGMYM